MIWFALAVGALIGASASAMRVFNSRIAGISGILGGVVKPSRGDTAWRGLFLAGLLVPPTSILREFIGGSGFS